MILRRVLKGDRLMLGPITDLFSPTLGYLRFFMALNESNYCNLSTVKRKDGTLTMFSALPLQLQWLHQCRLRCEPKK